MRLKKKKEEPGKKKERSVKEAVIKKEPEAVVFNQPVEEITSPKLFSTHDRGLAQRLEVDGGFTYKNITVDNSDALHQAEHFTFNATEKEVKDFLDRRG